MVKLAKVDEDSTDITSTVVTGGVVDGGSFCSNVGNERVINLRVLIKRAKQGWRLGV